MHNFCLLNIRRPVLSSVFSLLLVVFGLYTFFELSTRELPKNLQPPEVVISTKYTGASPSIIASEISEPIELAVGGAEGIKSIDNIRHHIMSDRALSGGLVLSEWAGITT